MYKLATQFKNFKFSSSHTKGPYNVEWFFFDENATDEDGEVRAFTHAELTLFLQYTAANDANFEGDKNYSEATEEDLPYISEYAFVSEKELNHPTNIILKINPELSTNGIYETMEVQLVSQNGSKIDMGNLPFSVIGKIIV